MKLDIQGSTVTLADWRVEQLANMVIEDRPSPDLRAVWAEEGNTEVRVCDLGGEGSMLRQHVLYAAYDIEAKRRQATGSKEESSLEFSRRLAYEREEKAWLRVQLEANVPQPPEPEADRRARERARQLR